MENQKLKKRKRTVSCFKDKWLTENVVTSTPNCYDLCQIVLGNIFVYDPDIELLVCTVVMQINK